MTNHRILLGVLVMVGGCAGGTSGGVGSLSLAVTQPLATPQAEDAVRAVCHGTYATPGACQDCVAHAANDLKSAGAITGAQHGELLSSFAQGECRSRCVLRTCAIAGASCGGVSDGCGGALNCGGCKPPTTCGGGGVPNQCGTVECANGFADCTPKVPGCETNVLSDFYNCGQCGNACPANTACVGGACQGGGGCGGGGACAKGQSCCAGTCVDFASDPTNCGACTSTCAKGTSCVNGACVATGTCTDGIRNGSETDVDCGGTCTPCANGKMCASNADCQSGLCSKGICG